MDQINLHLESLIYTSLPNEKLLKELSKYLKCGVQISEKNFEFRETFGELVGGILTDDFNYSPKHSILLCETVAAISSQFCCQRFESHNKLVNSNFHQEMLPKLLQKLIRVIEDDGDAVQVRFVEILSAVCLQSMLGYFMPEHVFEVFQKVLKVSNHWTQYRIARSASRYGQHFLAAHIYQKISNHVSLEKFNFFLVALMQISKAECILMYGHDFDDIVKNYSQLDPKNASTNNLKQLTIVEKLNKSITLYWKALATLRVSCLCNKDNILVIMLYFLFFLGCIIDNERINFSNRICQTTKSIFGSYF